MNPTTAWCEYIPGYFGPQLLSHCASLPRIQGRPSPIQHLNELPDYVTANGNFRTNGPRDFWYDTQVPLSADPQPYPYEPYYIPLHTKPIPFTVSGFVYSKPLRQLFPKTSSLATCNNLPEVGQSYISAILDLTKLNKIAPSYYHTLNKTVGISVIQALTPKEWASLGYSAFEDSVKPAPTAYSSSILTLAAPQYAADLGIADVVVKARESDILITSYRLVAPHKLQNATVARTANTDIPPQYLYLFKGLTISAANLRDEYTVYVPFDKLTDELLAKLVQKQAISLVKDFGVSVRKALIPKLPQGTCKVYIGTSEPLELLPLPDVLPSNLSACKAQPQVQMFYDKTGTISAYRHMDAYKNVKATADLYYLTTKELEIWNSFLGKYPYTTTKQLLQALDLPACFHRYLTIQPIEIKIGYTTFKSYDHTDRSAILSNLATHGELRSLVNYLLDDTELLDAIQVHSLLD